MAGARAPGYTPGMKTAVSIPDRIFQEAERYAKRAKKSRSQVFSEAVAEYLARRAPDNVTESMNAVLDALGDDGKDRFVAKAAKARLKRVEW